MSKTHCWFSLLTRLWADLLLKFGLQDYVHWKLVYRNTGLRSASFYTLHKLFFLPIVSRCLFYIKDHSDYKPMSNENRKTTCTKLWSQTHIFQTLCQFFHVWQKYLKTCCDRLWCQASIVNDPYMKNYYFTRNIWIKQWGWGVVLMLAGLCGPPNIGHVM